MPLVIFDPAPSTRARREAEHRARRRSRADALRARGRRAARRTSTAARSPRRWTGSAARRPRSRTPRRGSGSPRTSRACPASCACPTRASRASPRSTAARRRGRPAARAVRPLTIVAKHRMVRDDRYKLVYAPTRGGARWTALRHRRAIPARQATSSAAHPDVVARLQGELWSVDAAGPRHGRASRLPRPARARRAARRGRRLRGAHRARGRPRGRRAGLRVGAPEGIGLGAPAAAALLVGAGGLRRLARGRGRRPTTPAAGPAARGAGVEASAGPPVAARGEEAYQVSVRPDRCAGRRGDRGALASAPLPRRVLARTGARCPTRGRRPPGTAGELATTVSLRTSDAETQWTVPTRAGAAWTPQARVWNMNEGSFDQREAIFAPDAGDARASAWRSPRARASGSSPARADAAAGHDRVRRERRRRRGGRAPGLRRRASPGRRRAHVARRRRGSRAWGGQRVELRLQTSTDKPAPTRSVRPRAGGRRDATRARRNECRAPPMSLALWGDPVLVAREPTRRAVQRALDRRRRAPSRRRRASLHDAAEDAAKLAAPRPPLDALLPAVPGLMPTIDALAARGVRFTHAWSAATWTRPGTLAMLAGERSSELGIDTTDWILPPGAAGALLRVATRPCCRSLLRGSGAVTAAFVNNFFMAGYVAVGVDMGFERVDRPPLPHARHRRRSRSDALAWLRRPRAAIGSSSS